MGNALPVMPNVEQEAEINKHEHPFTPVNIVAPEPTEPSRRDWLRTAVSFMYAANRAICFILSAIVSFIFYSSLAGSNAFFFWFNGLVGVAFDVKRLQLWEDGKRIMASFFIAFAIFAFAGSSLMETNRASVRTQDAETISTLKANIESENDAIATQKKRIADTSNEVAPVKENQILSEHIALRDKYQAQLDAYKAQSSSDESISSFQIIADALRISDVSVLIWVFFILRATLLEISVLYSSKKKTPATIGQNKKHRIKNETVASVKPEVKYKRYVPSVNEAMGVEVHKWNDDWIKSASDQNRGGTLDRMNSLKGYISSLESAVKEELYVKEGVEGTSEPDQGNDDGVRRHGARNVFLWLRDKKRGVKIEPGAETEVR